MWGGKLKVENVCIVLTINKLERGKKFIPNTCKKIKIKNGQGIQYTTHKLTFKLFWLRKLNIKILS